MDCIKNGKKMSLGEAFIESWKQRKQNERIMDKSKTVRKMKAKLQAKKEEILKKHGLL